MPWANNYDMFIYYLGIIDTRGVKISLLDYEILIGKPIAEFQKGSFFTTEDFDSSKLLYKIYIIKIEKVLVLFHFLTFVIIKVVVII